jgi:hypothetical protein
MHSLCIFICVKNTPPGILQIPLSLFNNILAVASVVNDDVITKLLRDCGQQTLSDWMAFLAQL